MLFPATRNWYTAVFLATALMISPLFVARSQPSLPGRTATRRIDTHGTVRALYRPNFKAVYSNPEAMARSVLKAQQKSFQIDDVESEFVTSSIQRSPAGWHVRFGQTYRGIPVHQGDVVVSGTDDGRITMVMNNHREGIEVGSTVPVLDVRTAILKALEFLHAEGAPLGKRDSAYLVIYRGQAGVDHLAFRVSATRAIPYGDWDVFVEAHTGEVLSAEDLFVERGGGTPVSGSGYVYLSDPLSASHQRYGRPGFSNNDDADSDSLTFYRSLVLLEGMTYEDGMYKLKGASADITDIEAPADPPCYAEATADAFRYTRSQPGFEAVMCFYHATIAHSRLKDLGFDAPGLSTLRIDPHGYQGKDNSHYSPSGNWISFGTGGVNDAEDADVIWHEYAHAIHFSLVPGLGGGDMAAIGEAFGDYWATSYSRSLNQWTRGDAEYFWVYNWDGHNTYWSGRILDDQRQYPFDGLSYHLAGQIIATALAGILDDLGRDITDRIVVQGLMYLGPCATAPDYAQALLQADRDLYGGKHLPTLRYWLGTVKEFLPPPDKSIVLLVNDDVPPDLTTVISPEKGAVKIQRGSGYVSSADLILQAGLPDGYELEASTFTGLDTTRLCNITALILVGGLNPTPFDDAAKRGAITRYIDRGGKVLVEGGEVGYRFSEESSEDVDPLFRSRILHQRKYLNDATDATIMIRGAADRMFLTPNAIQSPIAFAGASPFLERDAVTGDFENAGTAVLAGWSGEQNSAAIIGHRDSEGEVRTLFLSFALSAVADSATGRTLAENVIHCLLDTAHQATWAGGISREVPDQMVLDQNYPNPFNSQTVIQWRMPRSGHVDLRVYDILGREVALLIHEQKDAGYYDVVFDATGISSGVYMFTLRTDRFIQSRKMLLLK